MASLQEKLSVTLKSRDLRHIYHVLPPVENCSLIDLTSNDYLSLTKSPELRSAFLEKMHTSPEIMGFKGGRLMVNGVAHERLENRLKQFFGRGHLEALLLTSGVDGNLAFFSCIPQSGDIVVHDEYIHISVLEGIRASRCKDVAKFSHVSLEDLKRVLNKIKHERPGLQRGDNSVFVAMEGLYSMDGTVPPLKEMVELVESEFPQGNAYIVVDEAHSTGVYGPQGRGLVSMYGLENRVFSTLHTFGKALGGSGAVLMVTPVVKEYLVNYAKQVRYTTGLSYTSVIQVNCALDVLESERYPQLLKKLHSLIEYFAENLRARLNESPVHIPSNVLTLPLHLQQSTTALAPIVPLLTSYPQSLVSHLQSVGIHVNWVVYPDVPKGKERVRVSLHSGNSKEEVELLVNEAVTWAQRAVRSGVQLQNQSVTTKL